MGKIRLLTFDELETLYPKLFKQVFGYYDNTQVPRTVIAHDVDGKITGFAAGYLFLKDTFYLQYGGVTGNFIQHRKFWKACEEFLYKNNIRNLITAVENINTNWQRVLMKLGFIPYGIKVNKGKIYIDYWKGIEVKDN